MENIELLLACFSNDDLNVVSKKVEAVINVCDSEHREKYKEILIFIAKELEKRTKDNDYISKEEFKFNL